MIRKNRIRDRCSARLFGRRMPQFPASSPATKVLTPPAAYTGWWKGYSGLYSDAGITPATADGTAVYRVADNVGSANADQSTLSLRPLLKTNQMPSGRSVLRYDGADDYSAATLDGTAYATLTLGCIIRPLNTALTTGIISWGNALNSGVPFIIVQRDSTNVRFYVDAGYRFTVAHDTASFKAYVLTYNGTQWDLYVNGVVQTPYIGTKAQQSSAGIVFFGNGFNGYANCDIGELMIWNSVVQPSAYLMQQAGL